MRTTPSKKKPSRQPQGVLLNVEAAVERMGDRDIYLEIARFFASHLETSLEALSQALRSGDVAEATRLAHSLKGNCATVGADALSAECRALEHLCRAEQMEQARALYEGLSVKLFALRDALRAL